MTAMEIKRAFAKAIATVRKSETNVNPNYMPDYPKAMMTAAQMEKSTATVNCGGGSLERVRQIMGHEAFKAFLEITGATAMAERARVWWSEDAYQIRIQYNAE